MKIAPKSVSKLLAGLAFAGATTAILAADGSVWPAGGIERGMTADHRAARAGDILTVVVMENANATSAQTKSSNRESSVDDAITRFVFSKGLSHNGEMPAISMGGKSAYTGGGQVNNTQSLTARAAVLVTDVLPNGNLVVEGTRRITFSGETQYVVLHGLVRSDDITANNTVLSSNVADARVEFISEGALTDAQKRGWLAKLYEKLRPL